MLLNKAIASILVGCVALLGLPPTGAYATSLPQDHLSAPSGIAPGTWRVLPVYLSMALSAEEEGQLLAADNMLDRLSVEARGLLNQDISLADRAWLQRLLAVAETMLQRLRFEIDATSTAGYFFSYREAVPVKLTADEASSSLQGFAADGLRDTHRKAATTTRTSRPASRPVIKRTVDDFNNQYRGVIKVSFDGGATGTLSRSELEELLASIHNEVIRAREDLAFFEDGQMQVDDLHIESHQMTAVKVRIAPRESRTAFTVEDGTFVFSPQPSEKWGSSSRSKFQKQYGRLMTRKHSLLEKRSRELLNLGIDPTPVLLQAFANISLYDALDSESYSRFGQTDYSHLDEGVSWRRPLDVGTLGTALITDFFETTSLRLVNQEGVFMEQVDEYEYYLVGEGPTPLAIVRMLRGMPITPLDIYTFKPGTQDQVFKWYAANQERFEREEPVSAAPISVAEPVSSQPNAFRNALSRMTRGTTTVIATLRSAFERSSEASFLQRTVMASLLILIVAPLATAFGLPAGMADIPQSDAPSRWGGFNMPIDLDSGVALNPADLSQEPSSNDPYTVHVSVGPDDTFSDVVLGALIEIGTGERGNSARNNDLLWNQGAVYRTAQLTFGLDSNQAVDDYLATHELSSELDLVVPADFVPQDMNAMAQLDAPPAQTFSSDTSAEAAAGSAPSGGGGGSERVISDNRSSIMSPFVLPLGNEDPGDISLGTFGESRLSQIPVSSEGSASMNVEMVEVMEAQDRSDSRVRHTFDLNLTNQQTGAEYSLSLDSKGVQYEFLVRVGELGTNLLGTGEASTLNASPFIAGGIRVTLDGENLHGSFGLGYGITELHAERLISVHNGLSPLLAPILSPVEQTHFTDTVESWSFSGDLAWVPSDADSTGFSGGLFTGIDLLTLYSNSQTGFGNRPFGQDQVKEPITSVQAGGAVAHDWENDVVVGYVMGSGNVTSKGFYQAANKSFTLRLGPITYGLDWTHVTDRAVWTAGVTGVSTETSQDVELHLGHTRRTVDAWFSATYSDESARLPQETLDVRAGLSRRLGPTVLEVEAAYLEKRLGLPGINKQADVRGTVSVTVPLFPNRHKRGHESRVSGKVRVETGFEAQKLDPFQTEQANAAVARLAAINVFPQLVPALIFSTDLSDFENQLNLTPDEALAVLKLAAGAAFQNNSTNMDALEDDNLLFQELRKSVFDLLQRPVFGIPTIAQFLSNVGMNISDMPTWVETHEIRVVSEDGRVTTETYVVSAFVHPELGIVYASAGEIFPTFTIDEDQARSYYARWQGTVPLYHATSSPRQGITAEKTPAGHAVLDALGIEPSRDGHQWNTLDYGLKELGTLPLDGRSRLASSQTGPMDRSDVRKRALELLDRRAAEKDQGSGGQLSSADRIVNAIAQEAEGPFNDGPDVGETNSRSESSGSFAPLLMNGIDTNIVLVQASALKGNALPASLANRLIEYPDSVTLVVVFEPGEEVVLPSVLDGRDNVHTMVSGDGLESPQEVRAFFSMIEAQLSGQIRLVIGDRFLAQMVNMIMTQILALVVEADSPEALKLMTAEELQFILEFA